MLSFEKITRENRQQALKLQVAENQMTMIETVEECLKEADELPLWRPVIIKDGEESIGFAMYGLWDIPSELTRVWLDRFFIDVHFQKRGYAKKALVLLLQKIFDEYHKKEVFLSVYEENTVAIGIYKDLGFDFNGELDLKGEKVMVKQMVCSES